ncbi:hypothetical protein BGX38DRAFT_1274198 [Terfezia claveryi]|nr:hypothetical protein BGX38DRAFT_1274198 [Terfezia claveryi]
MSEVRMSCPLGLPKTPPGTGRTGTRPNETRNPEQDIYSLLPSGNKDESKDSEPPESNDRENRDDQLLLVTKFTTRTLMFPPPQTKTPWTAPTRNVISRQPLEEIRTTPEVRNKEGRTTKAQDNLKAQQDLHISDNMENFKKWFMELERKRNEERKKANSRLREEISKLGDRIFCLEWGKGDVPTTPLSSTGMSAGNVSVVVAHANIWNPRPEGIRMGNRINDLMRRQEGSMEYQLDREESMDEVDASHREQLADCHRGTRRHQNEPITEHPYANDYKGSLKVEDVGEFSRKDVEYYIRSLEVISEVYGEDRVIAVLPRCMKGVAKIKSETKGEIGKKKKDSDKEQEKNYDKEGKKSESDPARKLYKMTVKKNDNYETNPDGADSLREEDNEDEFMGEGGSTTFYHIKVWTFFSFLKSRVVSSAGNMKIKELPIPTSMGNGLSYLNGQPLPLKAWLRKPDGETPTTMGCRDSRGQCLIHLETLRKNVLNAEIRKDSQTQPHFKGIGGGKTDTLGFAIIPIYLPDNLALKGNIKEERIVKIYIEFQVVKKLDYNFLIGRDATRAYGIDFIESKGIIRIGKMEIPIADRKEKEIMKTVRNGVIITRDVIMPPHNDAHIPIGISGGYPERQTLLFSSKVFVDTSRELQGKIPATLLYKTTPVLTFANLCDSPIKLKKGELVGTVTVVKANTKMTYFTTLAISQLSVSKITNPVVSTESNPVKTNVTMIHTKWNDDNTPTSRLDEFWAKSVEPKLVEKADRLVSQH